MDMYRPRRAPRRVAPPCAATQARRDPACGPGRAGPGRIFLPEISSETEPLAGRPARRPLRRMAGPRPTSGPRLLTVLYECKGSGHDSILILRREDFSDRVLLSPTEPQSPRRIVPLRRNDFFNRAVALLSVRVLL